MPRVKWYHNGQPVREHKGVSMALSPQGEAVLRLGEVFPEDAGLYECKAVNPAGQISTKAFLSVESKSNQHSKMISKKLIQVIFFKVMSIFLTRRAHQSLLDHQLVPGRT